MTDGNILERSLERSLLNGFEYPMAIVVEVTRQGILLSKLRYLRALTQIIADNVQCPNMALYAHMGGYSDPHLERDEARAPGVHLIYHFDIDKALFRELLDRISKGTSHINVNNPQTRSLAENVIASVRKGKIKNLRALNPHAQGLILEPYVSMLFDKVGIGKRVILQNVELVKRESALHTKDASGDTMYYPIPLPTMEIDILVIIEMAHAHTILKGLERVGFVRRRW